MVIRQESFRHGHRQIRNTCLFNERPDVSVSLCVSSAFAENNKWALCAREQIEGAFDRFSGGKLPGRWIDNARQRLRTCIRIEYCTENICGQVKIDSARSSRDGSTYGACYSNTYPRAY